MTESAILRTLLERESRDGPLMFHPVREQRQEAWWPANEAATRIVHVAHIYEDIEKLGAIRSHVTADSEKQLLLKYVVIELLSLVEHFDRLRDVVMKATVLEQPKREDWFGLTPEERSEARRLFSLYEVAKEQVLVDLRQIRNRIGAHRELKSWSDNLRLWNDLGSVQVAPLLSAVRDAFEHVRKLDLFSWSRVLDDGAIHITGPRLHL